MRVAIHSAARSRFGLYLGLWCTLLAALALLVWEDFGVISAKSDEGTASPRLTVAQWRDKLQLRWDPASEALRKAKAAEVFIRDGQRQSRIALTSHVLQNGNIVYQPLTGNVMFRLQTLGTEPTSESVRYLAALPVSMTSKPDPFSSNTGTADRAAPHPSIINARLAAPTPLPAPVPAKPAGPFTRLRHEIGKLWPLHHNDDGGQR